jgi:hypothetical protein
MATIADVLTMLIPNGGYIASGDTFEGIEFLECEPITKEQFTMGFAQWDAWKAQQDAQKQATIDSRRAKLLALGLTEEELDA